MSRLFSRLENIGQGPGDDAPLPEHSVPDLQSDTAAPVASFAQAGAAPLPSGVPAMSQPIPGYAISAHLSVAPAAPGASARPDWGVRLWLASLLLLIALALLMLDLPERMYPLALQRQTPALVQPGTAPMAAVPESAPARLPAPLPKSAPAAVPVSPQAVQPVPAEPGPATATATAPVPRTARPEPRTTAAPVARAPARPVGPADGTAACSEAMLAMNLCSLPSP